MAGMTLVEMIVATGVNSFVHGHDTAIGTHPKDGGFCYSFVPQAPPHGYPSTKPHGNGLGTPESIRSGGAPSRAGQYWRTSA